MSTAIRRTRFMECQLRELVPRAARVAVLIDPSIVGSSERAQKEVEAAARALGLQIQILNATNSREIDAAFGALVGERADALFVSPGGLFNGRRVQLATMAARHAVPMTSATREIAEAGGLMSYGPNLADAWRVVRRLCRSRPQGCKAKGTAGRAGEQVRAHH